MDVYTAICSRRTVRDFEDRPIEMGVIKKLIHAGLKAPSNDHMREWEFVIVNGKETRARLLRAVYESRLGPNADVKQVLDGWGLTDPRQRDMYLDAIPKQYSMLYHAGCLLLPFFRQRTALLQPETLSALNGFASIWCCVENMLIAAAAEGILGVTRIPMENEIQHIKSVIGHPDDYVMPCYLALGYSTKDAAVIAQNEHPADGKIHLDLW